MQREESNRRSEKIENFGIDLKILKIKYTMKYSINIEQNSRVLVPVKANTLKKRRKVAATRIISRR